MSAFATSSSSSSASAEEATAHDPPSLPLTPLQSVAAHGGRRGYVDVHAHIIHEKFIGQEARIADDCVAHGLDYVVVNGLEPASNRQILAYAAEYPTIMLPALGIYPLDAACHAIYTDEQAAELEQLHQARSTATGDDTATAAEAAASPSSSAASLAPWPLPASPNWKHPFPPPAKFDVQAEIDFIEAQLQAKTIVAIGECGMDGHYLTDPAALAAQEAVLRQLLRLGVKYDVPVILHTRKVEKRVFDLLVEEGVRKADFHCYCGKLNLAKQIAEAGYYLSIPSAVASADKSSSFAKLATTLPLNRLLTETDSPYMGPVKGEANTPVTVTQSVTTFARLRGIDEDEVRRQLRQNFRDLFGL
eukprot:gene15509-11092_t